MLLEIGSLKRKKKQNKAKNKKKTKQKPKRKKNSKLHLVWAIPVPISTTKDVVCCSNGYIYHFLDYITFLLFVNANVIHNNNNNNNNYKSKL